MSIVSAEGVAVSYAGDEEPASSDITFTIEGGQAVALLGANGSGKSTLLKAITGELAVVAGTLAVDGPVAAVGQHEQLRRDIPVTTLELALMGAYHRTPLLRRISPDDRALAARALGRVGLAAALERPISELSGGQRQRALLARALVHGGDLLALDEPLAAIDPGSAARIHEVLAEERAAGHTLLVATHDLRELSRWDRVLVLAGGRQIAFGPPETIDAALLQETYGGHDHGACGHAGDGA